MGKSMELGGGGRFAKLKRELEHKGGVTNAGALAASIGRKKYGAEKMSKMSHHSHVEKVLRSKMKGGK